MFGTPGISLSGLVLVFHNGSDDASSAAFDLDGKSLDANGFFVLCGDSGNVANCDMDVTPNTDLVQNGADAVALYVGDAADFPNDTPVSTDKLVDAVVYDTDDSNDAGLLVLLNAGQPQVNERGGGDGTGHSNSRVPDGGTARNTDTYVQQAPTPGVTNQVLEIFEIQGSGSASPFAGSVVTTRDNVVTALGTDGFFIQTPVTRVDADPATSNGVFVFTGAAPTVEVGHHVDVTGPVVEFFDFTEFGAGSTVDIVSVGNPLPPPITLDGTTPSPDPGSPGCEFECYEGMLVSISGGSVSSGNQRFGTDPTAEVHIVAGPNRAFREPGIEYPGIGGLPVWDGNPEIFELDPDKLGLANQAITGGSSFDATGVLGFEFGGYELWPSTLSVTPAPLPGAVRSKIAGELSIGSLNMFRLFDDVNDPSDVNPDGQNRDDFVASPAEYLRRRSKLASHIVEVLRSPDILAVQEVEKLGVLNDLAADITALDGSVSYTSYLIEGNDVGTIDVGFMVRSGVQVDSVVQLGASETYVNPVTTSPEVLHDRPPLLLVGKFLTPTGDTPIAVMGVHNRSFSRIDDAVQGPRVRLKRLSQAQSIAQKVQDWQTVNPDVGLVVTGDFNDFQFTDGYVDALGQIAGDFTPSDNQLSGPDLVSPNLTVQTLNIPENERYSFIFRGSAQALDHALTSTSLDPKVTGYEYGRGNADAPIDFINDDATTLRSSDHDGLVLFIDATPPEIVLAEPTTFSPPNNMLEGLSVTHMVAAVEAGLAVADVYITSVSSDEPVDSDNGAGNDDKVDIVIDDCQNVQLRSRRHSDNSSNGRVYTVNLALADSAGNIGTAAYQVFVPKTAKKPAIDDGPAYTLASGCNGSSASKDALASISPDQKTASKNESIPTEYALAGNYPNPFNPQTVIEFALPDAGLVSLRVYDTAGREVANLVDRTLPAGSHRVTFDANDLPSGIYIYSIRVGAFAQNRTMVLLR